MTLKLDKAGRLVIPKRQRERLGLAPDSALELIEQPGGLLLKVLAEEPAMVQRHGLLVHQGRAEAGADWQRVLDAVREERAQALLKP